MARLHYEWPLLTLVGPCTGRPRITADRQPWSGGGAAPGLAPTCSDSPRAPTP